MKAVKLIIKNHLENALPLLRKFVEASLENSEYLDSEDYNSDDNNDDDFINTGPAVNDLMVQDDYYAMARRIFQAVILGSENGNSEEEDWELLKTVTDLYVSMKSELKSSFVDPELLEGYLVQLEHYQKKL